MVWCAWDGEWSVAAAAHQACVRVRMGPIEVKNAPPPPDRLSSHFVAHHVKFVVWTCERQQQSHPQSAMACEDKAAMASTELLHANTGSHIEAGAATRPVRTLLWSQRPGTDLPKPA